MTTVPDPPPPPELPDGVFLPTKVLYRIVLSGLIAACACVLAVVSLVYVYKQEHDENVQLHCQLAALAVELNKVAEIVAHSDLQPTQASLDELRQAVQAYNEAVVADCPPDK